MAQTQTPTLRYQSEGDQIDYTPSSAVYAGDIVVIGTMPFLAEVDIAANAKGALASEGVWQMPKDASTFSAGDAVYWNTTGNPTVGTAGTGCVTSTASGNNLVGFATASQATGDATVYVKATCAKRTVAIAGSMTADDITGSDSSLGIGGQAAAQGGAIAVTGGTSSTGGNAGGAITVTGGTPGVTGVGGAVTIAAGAGGSTSGAGGVLALAGGAGTLGSSAGGAVTIVGGAGSATNAVGGLVSNIGGAGAGSSAGGLSKIVGGVGGATGAGGAAQVTGGAGGATSGTGGAVTIAAGAAQGTTAVGGAITITGGASAGASGTAGAVGIDAGAAASGTKACVNIADVNALATYLNRGPLCALQVGKTLTALGTTQSSTPTAAQLLGGLLSQTGATGAGTVTLPSGTTLSSACPRTPIVGDTFDVEFYNLGGSQTLTITGATGTTVIGTAAIGTGKMAKLTFYNTGSNTWNIYVIVSA